MTATNAPAALHPYNRPLLVAVYQGSPQFPARVHFGMYELPGMPRAWADKAAKLIGACATKLEQIAEMKRIVAAIEA